MHMYPLPKFFSIEAAVQELGGGSLSPPPPLGQGVGQNTFGGRGLKYLGVRTFSEMTVEIPMLSASHCDQIH